MVFDTKYTGFSSYGTFIDVPDRALKDHHNLISRAELGEFDNDYLKDLVSLFLNTFMRGFSHIDFTHHLEHYIRCAFSEAIITNSLHRYDLDIRKQEEVLVQGYKKYSFKIRCVLHKPCTLIPIYLRFDLKSTTEDLFDECDFRISKKLEELFTKYGV